MSFTSASSRTESDSGHPGSCDVAAICSDTPFSRMLQAAEITNKDFPLFSTGELKGAVTILEMMNTEDLHNVCASVIFQNCFFSSIVPGSKPSRPHISGFEYYYNIPGHPTAVANAFGTSHQGIPCWIM